MRIKRKITIIFCRMISTTPNPKNPFSARQKLCERQKIDLFPPPHIQASYRMATVSLLTRGSCSSSIRHVYLLYTMHGSILLLLFGELKGHIFSSPMRNYFNNDDNMLRVRRPASSCRTNCYFSHVDDTLAILYTYSNFQGIKTIEKNKNKLNENIV